MSSVSSSLGPAYNAFYDKDSVSEEQSVDSYVVRDVHKRRDKARNKKTYHEEPKNPFSTFFASFGTCCLPTQEEINSVTPKGGKRSQIKGKKMSSSSSMTGGGGISNIVQNIPRFNDIANISENSSSDTTDRGRGSGGNKRNSRGSETFVNKNIKWKVALKKDVAPAMSPEQKCWACLIWCLRVENSEKITERMMMEAFKGAKLQKENVDITHLLKFKEEFFVLECLRKMESRMLEDIIGDMWKAFDNLYSNGAVYVIIEKVRVVGIYARKQGELTDVTVFDTSYQANRKYPPCYYGFRSLEMMQDFVSELYNNDSEVKKVAGKPFSTWLMRSKISYNEVTAPNYQTPSKKKEDWLNNEKEKIKDSKLEAKYMYTSMYKATAKPINSENVFSIDPATGIKGERQESIDRTKGFMGEQELEDEFDAKPLKKQFH